MTRIDARPGRGSLLPAAAVVCALLASGCGDDSGVGTVYPVRGKILLNNEPFTAGSTVIVFKPNASRGNKTTFEPAGKVDEEGNYTLLTKGRSGAPPGWYKVVVAATGAQRQGATKHRPSPQSLLPAKYGLAKTTPLEVEVVADPRDGAYDLKLTR